MTPVRRRNAAAACTPTSLSRSLGLRQGFKDVFENLIGLLNARLAATSLLDDGNVENLDDVIVCTDELGVIVILVERARRDLSKSVLRPLGNAVGRNAGRSSARL